MDDIRKCINCAQNSLFKHWNCSPISTWSTQIEMHFSFF